MMIDINAILESPDRDDEIRKLLSEHFPEILLRPWIPLNWNLAMKMFREAEGADWMKLRYGMLEVFEAENWTYGPSAYRLFRWWALKAEEHHYILATIIAKETKE